MRFRDANPGLEVIPIPRSKPVHALDLVPREVYVVVKVYRGIEGGFSFIF